MRKTIMDGLRKAGQRLNEFDKAYAARAAKDMGNIHDNPLKVALGGTPLFPGNTEIIADSLGEKLVAYGMLGGQIATNAGYRYGLPAAGVTLAGKGLFDLTQGLYAAAAATPVFGGPEDGSQPGQLPLS